MSNLNNKEISLARQYKISEKTLKKIKESYGGGKDWFNKFKENPYKLMEVDGFSFKRADLYAEKLGFDMNSPIRVKACTQYIVEIESDGDTILNLATVVNKMAKELKLSSDYIKQCIFEYGDGYILLDYNCKSLTKDLVEQGNLPMYITLPLWYNSEKFIFNWAKELNKTNTIKKDINIIERILEKNPTLNDQQKYTVKHFFDKNFNVLIGKSGSGKSYLTKVILDLLDAYGLTYTLLAPTGIASFNLTEKTGRKSQTIHRRYFMEEEIETDYVIIDEFGMCGCQHIDMLNRLISLKDKTKPLFIGDKYQLPSISAGDFLASIMNLIRCNVLNGNIFELSKIMRASDETYIPYLCNMFCENNKFDSSIMNKNNLKGVEFFDRQSDLFLQIEKIINDRKWNPKETGIIMPQRKGDFGCDNFNEYMQLKNNSEVIYEDDFKRFKKNDILMHIKNNSGLNIYNGELIEILDKKEEENEMIYYIKRLYDGKILKYDEDEVRNQIMLSYANTVHKSQGATIKNVIFIAISDFSFMLSRNLAYVGMSRASENLVVICDKDTLVKTSYKNLTDKRKTFLNILCEKFDKTKNV